MSISESNERFQRVLDQLMNLYQSLNDQGQNRRDALRLVFSTACLSPDVMGVGF